MAGSRVVIVGAGVVGAALADELSARGWDDITVIEQGELPAPGGSSSHTPGLVFQANCAKIMTQFARYTVDKFRGLGCYFPIGGLEIATTPARLTELHRRQGWLTAWGVDGMVIEPDECVQLFPLLDRDQVLGGLHVPTDGLAKAVGAVDAQLSRAQDRGVRVLEQHEVLDIRTVGDRVTGVITDKGQVPADIVVCCAGIWGPKIARMVGMNLPLTPLAHQFAWTGQIPTGQREEAVHPIVRHQDGDLYYRERFETLGIGYYGHRPMPVDVDDILSVDAAEGMPSIQPFTEEDFAEAWRETNSLLPATRETKIEEGINGLLSFTADDMPLLGESPDISGFWVAEAVWATHSAGVGRAMAEWIADGYCSSFDLHECDVNRFEPHQLAPEYVHTRVCQNFTEVYHVKHPLEPIQEPRPLRTSPFYARQQELGAYFLEASGWERPQWYEANAGRVRDVPQPDEWVAWYWSPISAAEARTTRENVALYDMTSLKRLEVGGPGAFGFLQWMVTGDIDKPVGSVAYCLLLDEDGGIRGDVTVARLKPRLFLIGANSNLDFDWLRRHLPANTWIRDSTAGTCCVGVWGPRARDVVRPLITIPGYLGTVPVTALRSSYLDEPGWELCTTADMGAKLWDTLWEAGEPHGVIAAGHDAFTSLRLEQGHRAFGTDMTFEHDPYEAGLGFAVDEGKDFLGKAAVLRRKENTERKLCRLTLGDVVMGKEPVYDGETCVGYVTSAAYGYTIGTAIAYAWLPARLGEPGQTVHIGYFNRRLPAVVVAEP
ncbi:FAD-dependent oxidoreductase [Amycolatopsis sp. GM8]|uniref:GcvT family protein n=1 Tax=Amycolatopsis sp. GM8 TaxID=2896530 RepID=UPI001F40D564|nr:FAD-dependent oxidoreductase [Amycolatopsis sp. GM8]